jgi:hypothetical protein
MTRRLGLVRISRSALEQVLGCDGVLEIFFTDEDRMQDTFTAKISDGRLNEVLEGNAIPYVALPLPERENNGWS